MLFVIWNKLVNGIETFPKHSQNEGILRSLDIRHRVFLTSKEEAERAITWIRHHNIHARREDFDILIFETPVKASCHGIANR